VIGRFRNRPLRNLWEKGDTSGVSPNALPRIKRILSILDAGEDIRDLDVPGFRFHALKGRPKRYSMRVTGNWRVTFEWDSKTANGIDLEDYHGR
jgi:proteic killer suppression protein